MFVTVIYQQWSQTQHPLVMAVAVAALLKVTFEWVTENAILSDTLRPSVPQAHVAAIIAGVLYCDLVLRNKQGKGLY